MNEATKKRIETLNEKLVEKAKTGDRVAMSKLCLTNEQFIYKVMLSKTRNKEIAEDLTQDVLVKMITNISQYVNVNKTFRGWLSSIIFSVFIDHTRKESHRIERFSSSLSTEFSEYAMRDEHKEGDYEYNVLSHSSVEHDYIMEEQNEMMKKIIQNSIEALSNTDQKRAIYFRLFNDLTYIEISERIGVNVNQTKSLLNRAKAGILKHIVENNYHLAGKMLEQRILKDKIIEKMSEEEIASQHKISLKKVERILQESLIRVYKETFFKTEDVKL